MDVKKVSFKGVDRIDLKMKVFWDIVPCSIVEVDGRFRGAYCSIICEMSGSCEHDIKCSCSIKGRKFLA
jgi:hypothetical protein